MLCYLHSCWRHPQYILLCKYTWRNAWCWCSMHHCGSYVVLFYTRLQISKFKIHWENVGVNTPNKKIAFKGLFDIVWCCWSMWLLYRWDLTFGNQYFGDITRKNLNCFWENSYLACARITSRKKNAVHENSFSN